MKEVLTQQREREKETERGGRERKRRERGREIAGASEQARTNSCDMTCSPGHTCVRGHVRLQRSRDPADSDSVAKLQKPTDVCVCVCLQPGLVQHSLCFFNMHVLSQTLF